MTNPTNRRTPIPDHPDQSQPETWHAIPTFPIYEISNHHRIRTRNEHRIITIDPNNGEPRARLNRRTAHRVRISTLISETFGQDTDQ